MALRFMEERIDFAGAFRWAARLGWQTGICNHFSWMVDDQHILINPRGLFWSEITASTLVLLDGDDNIIEGGDEVGREGLRRRRVAFGCLLRSAHRRH